MLFVRETPHLSSVVRVIQGLGFRVYGFCLARGVSVSSFGTGLLGFCKSLNNYQYSFLVLLAVWLHNRRWRSSWKA